MPIDPVTGKRTRGRPRKDEIVAKKKPGTVGRPKGDAGVMAEYKARMLASPKSRLVLEKIFDAALDDNHKNQAAAWKLVMERILPASMFDKASGGAKPSVEINITTTDATTTISSGNNSDDKDVIDGELIRDDVNE